MSREGRKRWSVLSKFVIGKQESPMMVRWRLIQTPWFGVYVHFIYREDLDRDCHDHPWDFGRMVLKGGYTEEFLQNPRIARPIQRSIRRFRPSTILTEEAHRITTVQPGTVSLVVVGPKKRVWGFWEPGVRERRWIDYREYIPRADTAGIW